MDFIDDHGPDRGVTRGVNTGDLTNYFGFIAKSSMNDLQLDRYVKYRPIDYTWEWVNYIDSPVPAIDQNRVVSDITIDHHDNIYVVGSYDSPSEIGRSGATTHVSDDLQFEPGYNWQSESGMHVFVSRYNSSGVCEWTRTSSIDSQTTPTQKINIHNNSLYVLNVADGVNLDTQSLSGVCIHQLSTDTGLSSKSTQFNTTGDISVSDFKVNDHDIITITGSYTGEIESSTITFLDKPESTSTSSGYFAMIPLVMNTARMGSVTSTGVTRCAGTTVDYSTGHNLVVSESDQSSITANLGPGQVQATGQPGVESTFIISHEL